MQTEELTGLLHACPLFADISPVTVGGLLADAGASAALFPAGEAIPAAGPSGRPQLVVLLRFLRAGDLFGIANLFSDEASVSTVRAETDCSCLLLTENAVRYLLDTDAGFRENYIGFLSGRVRFLNKKIGYLTAGSAERRLALYLADRIRHLALRPAQPRQSLPLPRLRPPHRRRMADPERQAAPPDRSRCHARVLQAIGLQRGNGAMARRPALS